MRIATWNVNGIRPRLDHIRRFLSEWHVDVLCMQEIKIADDIFPHDSFETMGYSYRANVGQKAYHGVAIISKMPFDNSFREIFAARDDKRHVAVAFGSFELHCFYIPSGGHKPDRAINEKFDHKLRFYEEAKCWFESKRKSTDKLLLVGDFNVAPKERDVWNHKKLIRSVGHTPQEVEHFTRFQKSLNFEDLPRRGLSDSENLYTWWGYRYPQSVEKDYGWRLDHAWASPALAGSVKNCYVVKDTRLWDKPSDHIPVIIEL